MKQYIVYFENNKAVYAIEGSPGFSYEAKMIANGNIQWLVVCAINNEEALVIADSLVDTFLDRKRA
ncbi:MAG: hypothetical protein K0Q79_2575 [Flavipsychrobacter sp.]|jgi:hypothetical protein|nr:hypothetical protein [Flavipsychrobacter sp.]